MPPGQGIIVLDSCETLPGRFSGGWTEDSSLA